MQTEETRALIQAVFAAFSTRDAGRIAPLFHDDARWIAPKGNATAEALGMGEDADGFERGADIAAFIAGRMGQLFQDVKVEFRGLYADGPVGVADYRFSAVTPSGATYDNDYCFIFTCADGKVRQMREYMDTLGGRKQLFARGHPMAQPSPAAG